MADNETIVELSSGLKFEARETLASIKERLGEPFIEVIDKKGKRHVLNTRHIVELREPTDSSVYFR